MLHFSTWKTVSVLAVIVLGALLAVPNVLPSTWRAALPASLSRYGLTLGLDLQGGSYLLLEVDRNAVVRDQVGALRDDARRVLRDAKIGFSGLSVQGGRAVQVNIRDDADTDRARDALRGLVQPIGNTLFNASGGPTVDLTQPLPKQIVLTLTDAGINARLSRAVDRSIEIVRRRVDELGTTEPLIQRQGSDRVLVQVPGLQDPAHLKDILGKTAKLEFRLVDPTISAQQALATRPPADSDVLPSQENPGQSFVVQKQVMVSGEDLTDAQPSFDQNNREPVVTFRFNTSGAQRFGRVTQENVNRPFAIVLDNKVVSAPVIREPILGGSGQISGSFTTQAANDLALLLRSGALPAPLTIVEERTVGPGLGADSIRAGERAALVGSLLVIGFMLVAYGLFGVFASVAVLINVVLIFAALSLLGATLTLPGIAGIVLTVGIAVDSNVLIYERIREEMRAGRSVVASLDAGFARALATILDSNITTFIAAGVLFFVGTGAVKGFAVTLGIGIITTVFTAFTVTRLIVVWWYRWTKPRTIPI